MAGEQETAELLTWLEQTQFAQFLRESERAFPTVETLHVLALTTVFGTIAIIDLRLCGVASTNRRFTEMANELLPWTWGAFALAVVFHDHFLLPIDLSFSA